MRRISNILTPCILLAIIIICFGTLLAITEIMGRTKRDCISMRYPQEAQIIDNACHCATDSGWERYQTEYLP